MTIAFPKDSQLPQLGTLLNESAVIRILSDTLSIEVLEARPKYVRYKPETSCIVQYQLGYRENDSDIISQSAHIKVYADHRASTKVNGGRAGRMNNRLEELLPHAPKVNYLPEVDGALQVFPADLDLPGLARIADSNGARKVLKKALELERSPDLDSEPELIRYKPGRKALFRYQVSEYSNLPLYGKVFENMDVRKMRVITASLLDAGIATGRVLGIVEKQNFIVHETVPGVALNEIREKPEYSSWMKPLATLLWQLHAVVLPYLPKHDLNDEINTLRELREQLTRLLPHLRDRLDQFVATVADRLGSIDDVLVTSHGDFYDDQALVDGGSMALIDLEALRRSHPLIDAGNMLAHLSVGSIRGDHVLPARDAFMVEIERHTKATSENIALFEAAGILKLAPGPFRRLEENWPERVEQIVTLAEARLAEFYPSPVTDPALPQLAALMDFDQMSAAIAGIEGYQSIPLEHIAMVRHKQGRRVILRYSLADSSKLYGKSFASKRGPKVFKITKMISESNAFGPDVQVPAAVGYLPDHKLMLLGEVAGEPVEHRLFAGDTEPAERIAFSLYHLHSSTIDLGRIHDLEKELSPLESRCADVQTHAPELASKARDILLRVLHYDHQHLCWRLRPIHRDMYHDQILVSRDQLAILDLDDAAMPEPAVDVANFTAHLMLAGIQRHADSTAFQIMIDAFRNQYLELDHDLDPTLMQFLEAATLLRLAGIHVSRENGGNVARLLLETANRIMDHITSGTIRSGW